MTSSNQEPPRRLIEAAIRESRETGVDYWLHKHPKLARYRALDPDRLPDVSEIVELSEQIRHGLDGVPRDWRGHKADKAFVEHSAQVAWFHELLRVFYGPIRNALVKARTGDNSSVETLVRFLEADPYCFRSGYSKADAINALTRLDLGEAERLRLRKVLLSAVDKPARREFRRYIRLARFLDDPALRAALTSRTQSKSEPGARNASWVLEGMA